LKLRSGYALPAFQASGILILIDAPLSASLSRRTDEMLRTGIECLAKTFQSAN